MRSEALLCSAEAITGPTTLKLSESIDNFKALRFEFLYTTSAPLWWSAGIFSVDTIKSSMGFVPYLNDNLHFSTQYVDETTIQVLGVALATAESVKVYGCI